MRRAGRIEPGPGQESVWDYPRPPRLEPVQAHLVVELGGTRIADATGALRVLETSHPPGYYLPPQSFLPGSLRQSERDSWCEWKGRAGYWTLVGGDRVEVDAAWSYPDPTPGFAALRDFIAVYPGRVDACWVDDERVQAQEGDFYGGWVTSRVVGPFKGAPGTWGW
jgi:uncharacterized protein (DUF427 family)